MGGKSALPKSFKKEFYMALKRLLKQRPNIDSRILTGVVPSVAGVALVAAFEELYGAEELLELVKQVGCRNLAGSTLLC
jgi:hypothetical protein